MSDFNEDGTLKPEVKQAIILETEERVKAQYESTMATIRSEEKAKLYPEISKLKLEVETANSKLAGVQTELTAANDKLTTVSSDKDAEIEKLKADLLIKEQGDANMSTETKELKEMVAQLLAAQEAANKKWETKEAEWAKESATREIGAYRSSKLADLDESMHDVVRGTTKEEVDASFEIAKSTFEKLSSRLGSKINSSHKVPASILTNSDAFKNMTEENVLGMSDKDFAEFKNKIGIGKKR